jgi:DNA helicase-2/ATP-dependent DNA helicase PcrA
MEFRSHLPAVIEVAKEYKMLKWRQQVVDFDDILAFWAYLSQHAEIGAELRNRFRHVMLDEYQDNNHLQSMIVHGLGDLCAGSMMAVGDPAQSIYGFRGASPSTMYAFKNRWPDASVYLIERNYRSSHEIVATADTVDRNMSDRFERRLVSARGPSGVMPLLTNGQDQSDCTGHLVSLIHDKWKEEGIPLSEQAILVRSTNRARRIELELESMGIPYRFVGGIKIKEAAHVKDMLAALKFVINPGDQMSLVRLLTGFKGVGDKTVDAVVSRVYGDDASSGPRIGQGMEDVLPILEEAIAAEKRAKPLVVVPEVLRKVEAQRDSPNKALIDVVVGLQDMLAHVYKDSWEWRRKELAFFMDLAKEYSSIDDFLQTVTLDASHDKESDNPDDTPDVLTVSTIHGAKGLEWRCVYIPEFVEKHIPSVSAKTQEELDDELRLFYVAVTRARDELHFLKPLNLVHENSQYASTSSRYEIMVSSHLQRFNRVEPARRVQSSRPAYEIDEDPADEPRRGGPPPAGPSSFASFSSFSSFNGPSRR